MRFKTTRFGELEVPQEGIINFPEGLLGFEKYKKYVLLPTEENSPLLWLQSTEEPDLAFIVAEPGFIVKGYEFDLPSEAREKLEVEKEEEVQVLCLLVIPEDPQQATVNLKGPLVLNLGRGLACQVVLKEDYSTRHPVFNEASVSA